MNHREMKEEISQMMRNAREQMRGFQYNGDSIYI